MNVTAVGAQAEGMVEPARALALVEPEQHTSIVNLEQARALLAQTRDVDEVLKIHDYATAARVYAEQARLGLEAQNAAAEIKLRAERRAGELLSEIPRDRGVGGRFADATGSDRAGSSRTAYQETLERAQIPATTARRYQQIAMVPSAVFERHVAETRERGRELTTAGLAQVARELAPAAAPKPARRPEVSLARPTRVRILVGDVRAGLRSLPPKSVHAVTTSPPYYGLRDYAGKPDDPDYVPPRTWGGSDHEHDWGEPMCAPWANEVPGTSSTNHPKNGDASHFRPKEAGQECECGAWLGQFGQEPIPDCLAWARGEPPCARCYVCHTRTILADLWPVLRDDATVWWNLGESYSGSGKGPTGWSGVGDQEKRQGFHGHSRSYEEGRRGSTEAHVFQRKTPGVRRKSQIGIPDRVKLAAIADGWIVRADIPWLKRSAMPESVSDRPAKATERVLLLSKSERNYWDPMAVRMPGADPTRVRKNEAFGGANGHTVRHGQQGIADGQYTSRSRRDSDWFFESWQGLMLDEETGEPLALVVNPQPFPGAHFAVFSPKFVEPMILASTSEKGCCPACGAPWTRDPTLGWSPFCSHYARRDTPATTAELPKAEWDGPEPVPCTMLDLFWGAGSTGISSARNGRDCIGIELSPKYAVMSRDRIMAEAPMLVDVQLETIA